MPYEYKKGAWQISYPASVNITTLRFLNTAALFISLRVIGGIRKQSQGMVLTACLVIIAYQSDNTGLSGIMKPIAVATGSINSTSNRPTRSGIFPPKAEQPLYRLLFLPEGQTVKICISFTGIPLNK